MSKAAYIAIIIAFVHDCDSGRDAKFILFRRAHLQRPSRHSLVNIEIERVMFARDAKKPTDYKLFYS